MTLERLTAACERVHAAKRELDEALRELFAVSGGTMRVAPRARRGALTAQARAARTTA